jgi:hypothetical protein
MDATTHQTMAKFLGLNNVADAQRLTPVQVGHEYVYQLTQANNVEIDDSYQISSRCGYTSVKTGSSIHSLWADKDVCLYADGYTLYQMSDSYVLTTIRSDLRASARISYARANDRVYYTNGFQIGYVKGLADNALPSPGREFKLSLPAGQFIEFFKGCLYVFKDDTLYVSDPLCDYYDVRTGYRRFSEKGTLLRAVDDGIYVADKKTYFLKGKANEDFEMDMVYPHAAVRFTDVLIPGQYIDPDMRGNVAMWTAENGICLGDNSGMVRNLTEGRYTFTSHGEGVGYVRDVNNQRHYINSLY